ncbi:PAS domain-containing protein [Reinekea forsetii]|nr:PAS domain-containing protein [Reinekea forsetii]
MQTQNANKIANSMPLAKPAALNKASLNELQQAFSAFTSMSEQLSDSYHLLENRVVELSGELASLSEQRLNELNEKEALAEQLESLLHLMPAGVIVVDNRGFVQRINPAAEQWLSQACAGSETATFVGLPWGKIVKEAFNPKQTDYHEVSLNDGRLVSLETSALDNAGQLIVMTDQTETRMLQAQVSRQERLTAMGQMVASLAHQVRTPLSAAMLYASNLKNPKLDQPTHHKFVDKLVGRLHHLEKQVQDMLLFVKGDCQLLNLVTTEKLFELMSDAAVGVSNQNISAINWANAAPGVKIQCQADALVSAFMNIINNAFEAGGNGLSLNISALKGGQSLVISFKDNGPGMSKDELEKAQEPFVTTKSYGTGLGIPVVIATVKAHKGQLSIQSEVGKGTEFIITLPIYQESNEQ